jgi:putative ABC transport system permease protein
VLGAAAAQRLGIDRIYPGERIWVGGMWFYVAGSSTRPCSHPKSKAPCSSASPPPRRYLQLQRAPGNPTDLPARPNSQVNAVQSCSPRPPTPRTPRGRRQPTLGRAHRRADAKGAFNGLFLGLGAVALLVGAVGVANIMIISVLERRSEIGLRRALGATRGQIRTQFLSEAILLALARRRRRRRARRARDRDLRPHQTLGDRDPHPRLGGGIGAAS